MSISTSPSNRESQISRIRALSREGHHADALAAAEDLAAESPHCRDAIYLAAANLRCLQRIGDALQTLEALEHHHPRYSLLHQERGYCYLALHDLPQALHSFTKAVSFNPALAASWSMLVRLNRAARDDERAAFAAAQLSALEHLPERIVRAGSLFSDGDFDNAEQMLNSYIENSGTHPEALRLLARIAHGRGAFESAEELLEAAIDEAPDYRAARLDYARVLVDLQKYHRAKQSVTELLSTQPGNRDSLCVLAASHAGLGQHDHAIAIFSQLLEREGDSWELRMALGHSLKAAGRIGEAIEAYRAALAAKPGLGDAWWSLANLKNYRFSDAELERMRAEEAAPTSDPEGRMHTCFALGRAYEERSDFATSWQYYSRGNELMQAQRPYDPEGFDEGVRSVVEVCTAEFFNARAGYGALSNDSIFVVGMPRSGSTLVEQILASHSQIEGTQELPEIPRLVRELNDAQFNAASPQILDPDVLGGLTSENVRALGERYLADTRAYRGDKPFFVDKMPNNFRHIGLIHLMLPNATIIDVRREPMACCFSNLKQLFAAGQEFTYGMQEIGHYYRTYFALMRHWDAVLRGRVLRVFYEDMVEDLETHVRRMLEFCGLEFESACLDFYNNRRSVRTPSSEQVRQPIYREGLLQWRNYEPWLGDLKDALGDALIRYRD